MLTTTVARLILLVAFVSCAQIIVPDGFELRTIATKLNPTAMRVANDGRIFLCEKHGALRIIKNDVLLDEPAYVIQKMTSWNERGFVGVELDPNFESNGFVYIQYTSTSTINEIRARVSRITLDGDKAIEGSEIVLLDMDQYTTTVGWHNGGSLVIDASGKLFIFVGDIVYRQFSQRLDSTYGKILRINLNGSIPVDNPFYNVTTGIYRAIWAYGLRNPFMAVYDAEDDNILIGDVGEGTWEEININKKGANYGWPIAEGFDRSTAGLQTPTLTYHHNVGCAITGLAFYHEPEDESAFPDEYHDKLFFGDYCRGWIRMVDFYAESPTNGKLINSTVDAQAPAIVTGLKGALSMAQGQGGLYFLQRGTSSGDSNTNTGVTTGVLLKLIYTGNYAPYVHTHPTLPLVPLGYTKGSLYVGATGKGPLQFQWYKNGELLSGATKDTILFPTMTMADNGTVYYAQVQNTWGTARSNEVTILVSPIGAIQASINATQAYYKAGDAIYFQASAVDPSNDRKLFTSWSIELNHQSHVHPLMTFTNTTTINMTVPYNTEQDPVQWYTVYFTVSNTQMTTTVSLTVQPMLGTVTLATAPRGMTIILDEAATEMDEPLDVTGVTGMSRLLVAPENQTVNGTVYEFVGWNGPSGATNESLYVYEFSNQTEKVTAYYCPITDLDCRTLIINWPQVAPTQVVPTQVAPSTDVGPEAEAAQGVSSGIQLALPPVLCIYFCWFLIKQLV